MTPDTTDQTSKKGGRGKGKAVSSDINLNDDDDSDDGGRVAPRKRPESMRQEIIRTNKKFFPNVRTAKEKHDRQVANATSNSNDAEPETTTKPPKEPASKKPPAKKPAGSAAKSKAAKPPAIKNGKITKPVKSKQSEKPKRIHRKAKWDDNASVPDESEDEQRRQNTIAKLRETVHRHARWCPFVRINKKLHRLHRRTMLLEMSDSEDDGESSAPEEEVPEDNEGLSGPEEDESATESDEAEAAQPSKTTQFKQTAKQAASKKGAASKAASTEASSSKAASQKTVTFEERVLSEARDETSGATEAEHDSDADISEENMSANKDGVEKISVELVSDEESSGLSDPPIDDDLEQSQQEIQSVNQATDSQPTESASEKKRKRSEAGSVVKRKSITKRQRLQAEETALDA